MRLYHYTSLGHLPLILASSLARGDVPVGPRGEGSERGVWFTTDPEPSGHGLADGEMVTVHLPGEAPRQVPTVDKRAVRITVVIPSSDRRLQRWLPWTRKRLGADAVERLVVAGGGNRKAETWFVYLGQVEPARFAAVEIRRPDGTFSPATAEAIAAIEPHDID